MPNRYCIFFRFLKIPNSFLALFHYKIQVCRGWHNVINNGMLWKSFVENQVRTNSMWRGLSERRGWSKYLFRGCQAGEYNITMDMVINLRIIHHVLQRARNRIVSFVIYVLPSIPILIKSNQIGVLVDSNWKKLIVNPRTQKVYTASNMTMTKLYLV